MAFSAVIRQCRSATQSPALKARRSFAATASAAIHEHHHRPTPSRLEAKFGPMWPVIGIMGGMIGVACCIGLHTAKQQLMHSPSVQVSKRRRECVPEVDHPDDVIRSADKFEHKSFLRKVAHIQDGTHKVGPDSFTRAREAETLKSVGVRT